MAAAAATVVAAAGVVAGIELSAGVAATVIQAQMPGSQAALSCASRGGTPNWWFATSRRPGAATSMRSG